MSCLASLLWPSCGCDCGYVCGGDAMMMMVMLEW